MVARAHRSRLQLIEVVAESLPEDGRRGLSDKQNASVSQLELARHVAADIAAHAQHASMAVRAFSVSRVHARPKLRCTVLIITVLSAAAVCRVRLCGRCQSYGTCPGASCGHMRSLSVEVS